MKSTVFYAWQSDIDSRINKTFIRKAIELALVKLNAELTIDDAQRQELHLDHDTKGVPGIPEIARTIFEKIDSCGIFVGDLTFVGAVRNSAGIEKSLPNSKVVLELGYAMRAIGAERIICITNEAFGSVENLFFDLAHRRRPICYNLSSPAANRDAADTGRSKHDQPLFQSKRSGQPYSAARFDFTCTYLVQPQISHSHVSQVQASPLQSGQLQPTHVQSVLAHASAAVLQQPRLHEATGFALVFAQAHEPHSQMSHEQVAPLQSGHSQSTQAHPDLTLAFATVLLLVKYARAIVTTTSSPRTENSFI